MTKYFCMPRDDPKTEMAAISEETHSQTVGYMLMRLPRINSLYICTSVDVQIILMIIFPVREKSDQK